MLTNMSRRTAESQIRTHLQAADTVAMAFVEQEARRIMRNHTRLREFVMGMGSAFFVDKDGSHVQLHDREYLAQLNDFFIVWDSRLKITGSPMRFTADGPVRTNW